VLSIHFHGCESAVVLDLPILCTPTNDVHKGMGTYSLLLSGLADGLAQCISGWGQGTGDGSKAGKFDATAELDTCVAKALMYSVQGQDESLGHFVTEIFSEDVFELDNNDVQPFMTVAGHAHQNKAPLVLWSPCGTQFEPRTCIDSTIENTPFVVDPPQAQKRAAASSVSDVIDAADREEVAVEATGAGAPKRQRRSSNVNVQK
jgi:hypothetical protein